jgi:hypothetical protein
MAAIANLFLDGGQIERFEEWVNRGIYDAAGQKVVQDYLRGCRAKRRRIGVQHLLGRPLAVAEEDIRLRAYLKWEAAGRPKGDGVLFWLEAEKELQAEV